MIRKILLIQICIVSAFGQLIQEPNLKLNSSQLSSSSASLGFNVINVTEAANIQSNGLKPNQKIGQQSADNNGSKTQNKNSISEFPADFMSDEVSDHFFSLKIFFKKKLFVHLLIYKNLAKVFLESIILIRIIYFMRY